MRYIKILLVFVFLILTSCQSEFEEIDLQSGKIAFISSRYNRLELFMTDSQSKDIEKMMDSDKQILDISISPDLRYVILREAELVNNDLVEGKLFLYDLKKQEKKLIDINGSSPSWSPEGNKFIYRKRSTDDYKSVLILSDPSLKNKKVLKDITEYSLPWDISWSPDGLELLLYKPYGYHPKSDIGYLYRYNLSKNDIEKIELVNTYNFYNAEWSPNKNIIAAGIYDSNMKKYFLALINPDSGDIQKLTYINNGLYRDLDWSYDGTKIAFTTFDNYYYNSPVTWPGGNTNVDVFVYDIENDEITNVSNSKFTDYQPEWIP